MMRTTLSSSHPSLARHLCQVLPPRRHRRLLPQCQLPLIMLARFVSQSYLFVQWLTVFFVQSKRKNHVYLFYEEVDHNSSGARGEPGDKHFKCRHGAHKILTITKKMRSSLNGKQTACHSLDSCTNIFKGLIGHLKNFPHMYELLDILNSRESPPTADEIAVAEGRKVLDPKAAADWLLKLEKASNRLTDMFKRQLNQAAVSIICIYVIRHHTYSFLSRQDKAWSQEEFERLLAEWMVVCDQPFEEVDRVEFRRLLEYTHMRPLHIPHRKSMKAKIMKMGQDTIQGTKDTLAVSLVPSLRPSFVF